MENLQNNQIMAFLLFIGLCIALTLPIIVLKYKEIKTRESEAKITTFYQLVSQ